MSTRNRILVYIAGPYNGPTPEDIDRNVEAAVALGREVVRLGYFPVIPHAQGKLLTAGTTSDTATEGTLAPREFWLTGDLALLEVCHAVLLTSTWEKSEGARIERDHATRRRIPVFETLDELKDFDWVLDIETMPLHPSEQP